MGMRALACIALVLPGLVAPVYARSRPLPRRTPPHLRIPLMPESAGDELETRSLDAKPILPERIISTKRTVPRFQREAPRPKAHPARLSEHSVYFASARAAAARRLSDEERVESSSEPSESPRRGRFGFGFELGTLTSSANSNADALGLELMMGGRLFARLPLTRSLFVMPTLGYFHRSKSEASVSVTEHDFEGGASLLYTPWPAHRTILLFGLAQKVDALVSNITILGNSSSTPLGFRYRLGPAMEVSSAISSKLNFVLDAEYTVTPTSPIKAFPELTLGLMFK